MKNQIAAKISLTAYVLGDSFVILFILALAFIIHPAIGLLLLIFPVRLLDAIFECFVNLG